MLATVEIDPGYVVEGALGQYDDVQLVGDFGIVDVEPGYGVMGLGQYDNVELVGLGLEEGTKKMLLYGAVGLGLLAAVVGGIMYARTF